MAKGNFVAYYRVSTARQGQSGLGLARLVAMKRVSALDGGGADLQALIATSAMDEA